jgi:PAS domain S-box-containing protein
MEIPIQMVSLFPSTGWFRRVRAFLIVTGVVTGLAAGLAAWYRATELPPISRRPLRIGFEQNPPAQIRTESGFSGLAVETVSDAARRAGITLQWVETGTSSDEAFEKGLVDLWPLMTVLPDRRKRVHFTKPWIQSSHVLLLRAAMETPKRDFTGAISYFKMPLHLRLVREQFPEARPDAFSTFQEVLAAVCAGKAGAAFMAGRPALAALRDKPSECDSTPLRIERLPIGVSLATASTFESAAAAERLRGEINNIFRDGTFAATVAKYSYYGLDDTWATFDLMRAAERARLMSWGIVLLAIALVIAVWQALSVRRARRIAERANDATSHALSRYELVAHATNDAVFECDLRNGTVTWNEAVQGLFQYEADQVGSSISWWEERVHPDDKQRVLAGIQSAIGSRAQTWSDEYRFLCGNGSYASVVDRGYLLYDADGPVRLVRAIMDVTARRSLEEQLRQSQKMEAIGRLAGGVAHDFNNLLLVINGYTDMMLVGADKANPWRQPVAEIQKAGQRAAELTQQLLAFSRKQLSQPRVLDLKRVMTDSATILRRLIGEDIELILDLNPAAGSVRADTGQILQLLMNLAVNARDAMPAGGKLTLASANLEVRQGAQPAPPGVPPGDYVVVTVSDTGVGLSAEAQAHLFEPFFTTKAPGKGTGLGLSIVYGIVRQSGGFISMSSAEDKGTTVSIFLPRIELSRDVTESWESNPDEVRGNETVLLVEDQEQVRELSAVILKQFGYEVLKAANGDEALRLNERHPGPIHILLTDVLMPGMTGCALADRLVPLRPEMCIVYMSGYADGKIVNEAMQREGAVFLQKPFTPANLGTTLREALQNPR